jgi:hypothetical protein
MRHVHATLLQSQQFTACNVLHSADQRLARWLLMTADRTGSASFPLTQEYMAVMTGVQRTTVSTLANGFKERGLIRYSRGHIEILDEPGLHEGVVRMRPRGSSSVRRTGTRSGDGPDRLNGGAKDRRVLPRQRRLGRASSSTPVRPPSWSVM